MDHKNEISRSQSMINGAFEFLRLSEKGLYDFQESGPKRYMTTEFERLRDQLLTNLREIDKWQ